MTWTDNDAQPQSRAWRVGLAVLLVVAGVGFLASSALGDLSRGLFGVLGTAGAIGGLFAAGARTGWSRIVATALTGGLLCVVTTLLARADDGPVPMPPLVLLVGAVCLVSGGLRFVLAVRGEAPRTALLAAGSVSLVLAAVAVLGASGADLGFLGVLLGVQAVTEGALLLSTAGERAARAAD